MSNFSCNLPIFLTLIRLIASPFLMPVLIVTVLPLNILKYNILVASLFVLLSLTDFFDGYFARKYRLETKLGSSLDHIADKFLLFSTLIGLVYIKKIFFIWAVIFIGREFSLMSLREMALINGFAISVSKLGKFKTTFQLLYLTILIINTHNNIIINKLEFILLILSLFFTLYSAVEYFKTFFQNFKSH